MQGNKVWTIPNILTFIRIISVPIYTYFLIASGGVNMMFVYIAFGVLVGSASTDLFDGYIARHFNQVTELGKVLDPIADKLMCIAALIGLTVIGFIHWIFVVLIALKEALQLLFGLYLLTKKIVVPSNIFGKVAMWVLSIAILLAFFHPYLAEYAFYLDWIVLGLGVAVAYVALINYAIIYFKKLKGQAVEAEPTTDGDDINGQDL